MKYYHITERDIALVDKILEEGLKADDEGQIFLFENLQFKINDVVNKVSDHIAKNQVFLDEYAILEIDSKGFNSELIQDNVGEFTSRWQWILQQELIEPEFISFYGVAETNYKPIYKFHK